MTNWSLLGPMGTSWRRCSLAGSPRAAAGASVDLDDGTSFGLSGQLSGIGGGTHLDTSTASGFDNFHGRVEGTIDLSLPGGSSLGLSAAYDDVGSATRNATNAKVRIGLPIN